MSLPRQIAKTGQVTKGWSQKRRVSGRRGGEEFWPKPPPLPRFRGPVARAYHDVTTVPLISLITQALLQSSIYWTKCCLVEQLKSGSVR